MARRTGGLKGKTRSVVYGVVTFISSLLFLRGPKFMIFRRRGRQSTTPKPGKRLKKKAA